MKTMDKRTYSLIENYMISCMEDSAPSFFREYKYNYLPGGLCCESTIFYKDPNAPNPNRPNHIGTSVIIEVDNKILMEYRTDSDTWAIIGGGLKTDESLAECALREVYEETGIRLREADLEF